MKILRLKLPNQCMIPIAYIYFITICVGLIFFIVDIQPRKREFHSSFIAGVAISYFFLLVLPTLPRKVPQFTGIFDNFAFLAVLLGFSIIHLAEKYLFLRTGEEAKTETKKLISMQNKFELVKGNINDSLKRELVASNTDPEVLKELSLTIATLRLQRNQLLEKIQLRKQTIESHINKHFYQFRSTVNYIYQFFIGIIFLNLLKFDAVSAALFFLFAFTMVLIRRKSFPQVVDIELEIKIYDENPFSKKKKVFLSTSVFLGIIIGIGLDILAPLQIEMFYQLFAFICGIILYIVLRNDLPERHEGKPILFLAGMVTFITILLIAKVIESNL